MNSKRILVPVNLPKSSFQLAAVCARSGERSPIHLTLLNVVNLNVARLESRVYNEVCAESEAALKKLAKLFFGEQPSVRINVRVGRPHEEILAEGRRGIVPNSSSWPVRSLRVGSGFSAWARSSGWFATRACPTLVLPRIWKITPEQYREAMRTRSDDRSSVAWQQNAVLMHA